MRVQLAPVPARERSVALGAGLVLAAGLCAPALCLPASAWSPPWPSDFADADVPAFESVAGLLGLVLGLVLGLALDWALAATWSESTRASSLTSTGAVSSWPPSDGLPRPSPAWPGSPPAWPKSPTLACSPSSTLLHVLAALGVLAAVAGLDTLAAVARLDTLAAVAGLDTLAAVARLDTLAAVVGLAVAVAGLAWPPSSGLPSPSPGLPSPSSVP